MKRIIEVPGKREAVQPLELGDWKELLQAKTLDSVRVAAARDVSGPPVILEAADDDIAEVEFSDGSQLWVRVDEIPAELNISPARDSIGTLSIPISVSPRGAAERGLGSLVVAALRIFRVNDALASLTARELATRLEEKRQPGDGLYACRQPGDLHEAEPLDGTEPVLVFIHGTLSSTAGSFGKLTLQNEGQPAPWAEIERIYKKRILAFEHRTLSESPVESALRLATGLSKVISKGSKLHIVSHSRGGLVGGLLARGRRADGGPAFDPIDLEMFENASDPKWRVDDPQSLRDLSGIIAGQKWEIERFVRVACPARGTLLLSDRLDRWLSILLNVLGLGLGRNPVFEFAKATLLALAKRRTRPDELPGVAAQIPGSPLVALLNRRDVTIEGDLSVIAGDCEGRGILGTLKVLAADLFYEEDHDLVVHTASMDGGSWRPDRIHRFLDRGGEVDHFHYFANPRSRDRLLEALAGKTSGFDTPTLEATSRAPAVKIKKEVDDGSKPVVFLLPGIMGSHLEVESGRVWVDYDKLLLGKFGQLDLRSSNAALAKDLLANYQGIADHLQKSHFVVLFSYDWRRSIREAAAIFASALEDRFRKAPQQPVRILAHSMGGLVARLAFAERTDLWEEFRQRAGCRLVMAGTPSRGSWSIVGVLLGQDRLVRHLATLDLRHSMGEILGIISRFPGILELLPAPNEKWDFFSTGSWDELAGFKVDPSWAPPAGDLLEAARRVHLRLATAPTDPNRMVYVAGIAENGTPDSIVVDDKKKRVHLQGSGAGDGRVLWSDGLPTGVPVWYRKAAHGDLLSGDFEAFTDLLREGTTTRLETQQPTARGFTGPTFSTDFGETEGYLPSREEFENAVLGGAARATKRLVRRPLRVSIVHGNVLYARSPTAVGHYFGDGLFSAEADLDLRLDGVLRRRLAVGTYPGEAGSAEVFLPALRDDVGAIVIGLGRVGELKPGDLSEGIARGVLRYALTLDERRARNGEGNASRRFSSLLIGSGDGSMLTIEDSLRSVLAGVARANRALEKLPGRGIPLVEEVEIVEMWEDRALKAARLVKVLARSGEAEVKDPSNPLTRSPGGRKRAFEQERGGWWRQVQIRQTESGDLWFVAHTDKARLEKSLVPTQVELIRELIRRPAISSRTDPAIGVTLYELLLPEELKSLSQGEQRLVFQLDGEAALFPWELLIDRGTDQEASAGSMPSPLAVRTGLIRQLETNDYRHHPVRSDRRTALVVSDPAEIENLPPLPGARAETREVIRLLGERGFEIFRVGRFEDAQTTGIDPLDLLNDLMGRGYQIVHLAGHGSHDPEDPKRSGLIIGSTTRDGARVLHLLTPAEIRQLRDVPELVFINACHLGRVDQTNPPSARPDRVALAANLGIELIKMGVRAVIAAGWEVDDAAARTFASVFYQAFLAGAPFGDAVQRARSETFDRHGSVNTWGAYQCYGDPYFSLRGPQAIREAATEWVDPVEARDDIDNLTSDLKVPQHDGYRAIRDRLVLLQAMLPVDWQKKSLIATSLARAYQELGDFDRALELYTDALKGDAEGVGLDAVEQWANTIIRDSYERFRMNGIPSGSETPATGATQKILTALNLLSSLGETPSRLAIKAGALKRLAHIEESHKRLQEAANAYDSAEKMKGGELAYYRVNKCLCLYLYERRPGGSKKPASYWTGLINDAERLAIAEMERRAVFESAIRLADARLLRALIEGSLGKPNGKGEVLAGYRGVLERGVTPFRARGLEDQFAVIQWAIPIRERGLVAEIQRELSRELEAVKE